VPRKELTHEFSAIVHPLLRKIWSQEAESGAIALLRDTLLPKLVSGEVPLKDSRFTQRDV